MTKARVKSEGGLWPWVIAGLVLAAAFGVGAYFFFRETREEPPPVVVFQPSTSYAGPKISVKLYFPAKDGRHLSLETREVRQSKDTAEQARIVASELVRGPVGGLTPSFPSGARVKAIFIDAEGTAYVDFSRELQTDYPGGAWTETLTIYSLTNTLTENFPQIKRVQIMVEGAVVDSLAGHIDATRPFEPRTALDKE